MKTERHKDLENNANKYRQHISIARIILRLQDKRQCSKTVKHLFQED